MMMLEGTWSGYTSAQEHVVHRQYVTNRGAAKVRAAIPHAITYTDGTTLAITLTPATRKRLPAILGYVDLIQACVAQGVCRVADLKA